MLRHLVVPAMALAGVLWRPAFAQDPAALHRVHKLYIVISSSSSQAQHFHDLLDGDLREAGFEVAPKSADSEATLRVEFSQETHADSSFARATFTIKNPAGRVIWSGDLFSMHRGEGRDATVEELAQNCAERLRKDWEKGAK